MAAMVAPVVLPVPVALVALRAVSAEPPVRNANGGNVVVPVVTRYRWRWWWRGVAGANRHRPASMARLVGGGNAGAAAPAALGGNAGVSGGKWCRGGSERRRWRRYLGGKRRQWWQWWHRASRAPTVRSRARPEPMAATAVTVGTGGTGGAGGSGGVGGTGGTGGLTAQCGLEMVATVATLAPRYRR